MLDLSDLVERPQAKPNHECGVCYLIRTLEPVETDALERVLSHEGVTFREISDRLIANGYHIDQQTVSRHAQGQCRARRRYR